MNIILNRHREFFYHITPKSNLRSVFVNGIWPEMARSDTKRSYFVKATGLEWSIKHVAARHNCSEHETVIMVCLCNPAIMKRTKKPNVFYCEIPVRPLSFYSPEEIDTMSIEGLL